MSGQNLHKVLLMMAVFILILQSFEKLFVVEWNELFERELALVKRGHRGIGNQ